MKLKHIYLVLSIVGICITWYYNIQFFNTAIDPSLLNYIAETKTTFPAKSFSADLMIVVFVFFAFLISEGIRLKIKHWWIFIPLTFMIAIAFAFPLFLYVRANKLEKIALK